MIDDELYQTYVFDFGNGISEFIEQREVSAMNRSDDGDDSDTSGRNTSSESTSSSETSSREESHVNSTVSEKDTDVNSENESSVVIFPEPISESGSESR